MSAAPQSFRADWRGISLTISWVETYFAIHDGSYAVAHLEIIADDRTPLPVSETGYRSHFIQRETVEAEGRPVAYTHAWLNHEAAKPAWKAYVEQTRQLSLF